MKNIISLIFAAFFVLFILTTFVPYPAARASALDAGFSEGDIDTGLEYLFQRRLFSWGRTFTELGLLCALAFSSMGRKLADRFLAWTGERRLLAVLGVGVVYLLLDEALYLPIGIGRWYHGREWGMSNLDLEGWLHDHALYFAVTSVTGAIVLVGLYTLLIWFPRTWWLLAPLGGSMLAVAFAFLSPILINPLFNTFTPLEQTEWYALQPRVELLIEKAGVPVREILVMNGSRQSKHSNAYFTGFGPTRQIVLYDTLLKNHSPAEIESVLAHEIGHWQHDHIVKGIALGALAMLGGCFVLHCILLFAQGRAPWQLQSVADPAGLPLILLMMFLGSWAALPVQNGVSRYFERQADQTSLELADQPQAFIAGQRKLSVDNKSNVAPTPWNVWLFASHPPAVERIRMAKEWESSRR